ncbi:MAG: DUF91 domain-containing protein [Limnothrix sp. RL_2_0]|nr:DUF91 domain-containing protein [Limnothrix sp. RL_2_0]
MKKTYQLTKSNGTWIFESEAALENFIWDNLQSIFNLTPLKRQFYINGNICDILAVSSNKQLVIIELKNAEDRYVIQQLTRYYHALFNVKPFSDQIDYNQPVILKVLSPVFHKDNLIDCEYSNLSFDLFEFSIQGDLAPKFIAKKLKKNATYKFDIPFVLNQTEAHDIPPASKAFMNALARSEKYNTDLILKIREKILAFDDRIQEFKFTQNVFVFGKSKTNFCVDFTSKKEAYYTNHRLYLCIRLPITFGEKYKFSRVRLDEKILRNDFNFLFDHCEFPNINLDQRGLNRTTRTHTRSWGLRHYLHDFLRSELNIAWNKETNVEKSLEKYCIQENLPDPRLDLESLLMFF